MDCNTQITTRIKELLEYGTIPWTKPWVVRSDSVVSHATGKPYSLRNRMLLQYAGEYATFNQIKNAGGSVVKGSKSSHVYFNKYLTKVDDETGEVIDTKYFLTTYCVFRVGSQTEGVEPKWEAKWAGGGMPQDDTEALNLVLKYGVRTGVSILTGGSEAFYCPSDDTLQVPGNLDFEHREQYWHTVFHEIAHSTGAPNRLNRVKHDSWGDSKYATEELVADITACLCVARLGMDTEKCIQNSAAYIASWKKRIGDFKPSDFNLICHQAEVACDYIFNTQQKEK